MSLMGGIEPRRSPTDRGRSRAIWEEVFGNVSRQREEAYEQPPVRGGSYGRSISSQSAAFKRLLQAMRSGAPGGWSDDRWEQSARHFVGITYVAVHRCCEQMSQAEFQVYRKDPRHPDGKRPVFERETEAYRLVKLLERPNDDDSFGDVMYCFPPGTTVRMADGSQKPIEEVSIGEEVVTAERNTGTVEQLHSRDYDGDLIRLKLYGNAHLRTTPNHRILTERGYVPAGKLTKDDWVAIPRYSASPERKFVTSPHVQGEMARTKEFYPEKVYGRTAKSVHASGGVPWANYRRIPEEIELTHAAGRIFGLFLAEGHTEKNGGVVWSFGTHERDTLVAELCGLLESEWGLSPSTRICNEAGSVTQVVIFGKLWARLFRSLCGTKAKNKKPHPDLLSAPDDFLRGMLSGWADGDGAYINARWHVVSVSHDLAMAMYDIANHLGYGATISWRPPTGRVCTIGGQNFVSGASWLIMFRDGPSAKAGSPKARGSWHTRKEEKHYWRKVRGIDREAYSGPVYNIGVSGDNSYVAEGIGVHNCTYLQLSLTGTSLTWMVPNQFGVPMELYPVPTALAIPQPAINPDFPDGFYRIQPVYPYGPFSSYPTPSSAVGAPIPAQWMLKIKYPHPLLRYDGYSPLTAMRLHLDEIESMDRSRWYAMKRMINPSAILNFDEVEGMEPLPEPEIERIRAEFESDFMGSENTGRLFVSTPGAKLEPWGDRPVDMDYQAGWDQLVSFAMGGFGITKPAAGMVEDSSYSTLFATLKQLDWLTLGPACARISSHLTRRLAPFFGDDLIVEVRTKRIDDHDIKLAMLSKAMEAKAITINQLLKELDMPLTKEKWGEERVGMGPEQQGAPGGMPGMLPPGGQSSAPGQPPPVEEETGAEEIENDVEANRPSPGDLSRGALGPRGTLGKRLEAIQRALGRKKKSFTQKGGTSLYDRVRSGVGRKAERNGHAK